MWNLAIGSQQNKDVVVAAGAVRLLIVLLRSDHFDPQATAAGALGDLAASCQQGWHHCSWRCAHAGCFVGVRLVSCAALTAIVPQQYAQAYEQNKDAVIVAGTVPRLITVEARPT